MPVPRPLAHLEGKIRQSRAAAASPANPGSVPAILGAIPAVRGTTPARLGMSPATSGATPAGWAASPATGAATPAGLAAIPATRGAVPAIFLRVPQPFWRSRNRFTGPAAGLPLPQSGEWLPPGFWRVRPPFLPSV